MLQGKLTLHDLDVIVRQIDDLPALPTAVGRAIELTSPEVLASSDLADVIEEVCRVVSADSALAGRLIWMANSCGAGPVRTVRAAVAVLGLEAVRAAVLSNKVFRAAPEAGRPGGLDLRELWRHSLAVATVSRLLAARLNMPIDPDEAHLAGLMHDVGKLLLSETLPKSYARVLAAADCDCASLAECEKRTLGVDHLMAGRRLAQRWRLGAWVDNAAWLHHQPGEAIPPSVPDAGIVRVVALANSLVISRRYTGSAGSAGRVDETMMRDLGLSETDLAEISRQLDEQLRRNADLLALADVAPAQPRDRWLAKANAELGRLSSRLGQQERTLSVRAETLAALNEFVAGLSAESTLPDVLCKLAEMFAVGPAAVGGAVVTYSLDDRAGSTLAVRVAGARARANVPAGELRPQWRTFPLAGGAHGLAVPDKDAEAQEVLIGLLGDVEGWAGWVDLAEASHVALVSGGRWLGGVICPTGTAQSAGLSDLAPSVALTLGLIQQRIAAETVSEELAGASQLLAQTREALVEAKTVAAVGDLAAGAGHELNTPLAVVSGRAQLMRDRTDDPEQRKAWQTIADQAQRISDIITDLMDFASPAKAKAELLSTQAILPEAAGAFSSSDHPQAGSCEVDIEVEDDVPPIWADGGQVRAILAEVLANAATAAGPDGRVVLSATGDAAGEAVLVKVLDNGPGMDGSTLARVFTPFFSAQKAGRRRGLGLSKAKRYAENNGGRIWIDSEPGKGTLVTVRLPAGRPGQQEGQADNGRSQDAPSAGG